MEIASNSRVENQREMGQPRNTVSLGPELNRITAMAAVQEISREILSDKLLVKLLDILRKTTMWLKLGQV